MVADVTEMVAENPAANSAAPASANATKRE
jgi:hypothetical protein